jgi:hypothetical protein
MTQEVAKKRFTSRLRRRDVVMLAIGLLVAIIIRFIAVGPNVTHYHADFAVYINGQREMFDNFTYYEEVAACSADQSSDPKTRVHMHDSINSAAHVHDQAATWGAFFANLGFNIDDTQLKTRSDRFVATNDFVLTYWLNGSKVDSVYNKTIESEDVLLVTYGKQTEADIRAQFDSIPREAGANNAKQDPASCTGSSRESFATRLKRTLGIHKKTH